MALTRRSDRKNRKPVEEETAPASPNGSAVEAPAPQLNGRASLRLQKVLLQRNLVTEAQIEQALASEPPSGADFGDVLVSMRMLDEHELVSARAELYGMDVADLRQTSPEQQALDLIPDSVAREHFVIPMALDEVGLHVAMADQPSKELLRFSARRVGPPSGPCWRHSPRSAVPSRTTTEPSADSTICRGLRGSGGHPAAKPRHHDSDAGCRGRRCTGRTGRRSHPDAGHA